MPHFSPSCSWAASLVTAPLPTCWLKPWLQFRSSVYPPSPDSSLLAHLCPMGLSWVWPLFLVWSFLGSPEPASCSISIIPYHHGLWGTGWKPAQDSEAWSRLRDVACFLQFSLLVRELHSATQCWEHHCSLHWLWRNCETLFAPSQFILPPWLPWGCFNEGSGNTQTNQKRGSPSRGGSSRLTTKSKK